MSSPSTIGETLNNLRQLVWSLLRRREVQIFLVVSVVLVGVVKIVLQSVLNRAASSQQQISNRSNSSTTTRSRQQRAPTNRRSGSASDSGSAVDGETEVSDDASQLRSSNKTSDSNRGSTNRQQSSSTSSGGPKRRRGQQQQQGKENEATENTNNDGAAAAATPDKERSVRTFAPGYERLGHVLTVRVKAENLSDDELSRAARVLASTMKPAVHVVLNDSGGVVGELRKPTHAPLWCDSDKAIAAAAEIANKVSRRGKRLGVIDETDEDDDEDNGAAASAVSSPKTSTYSTYRLTTGLMSRLARSPTYTVHTEKSIRYSFDASRVMFSSGNTTERMHFGVDVSCGANETVVDMFAGIGYFTIPLACSMTRPQRIVAIEKNPDSCGYLACNALLNDCVDRLVILNGDNREVGGLFVGKANRVLMGYIPSCKEFLGRAVSFLQQATTKAPPPKSPIVAAAAASPASASASKNVSFAAGSTPPREKGDVVNDNKNATSTTTDAQSSGSDGESSIAKLSPSSKSNNDDDDNDQTSTTTTTTTKTKPSPPQQRPIGIIHYHFLCESNQKQVAQMTALQHLLDEVGPEIVSGCTVAEIRVVKSYAPKKFHCVADFVFA